MQKPEGAGGRRNETEKEGVERPWNVYTYSCREDHPTPAILLERKPPTRRFYSLETPTERSLSLADPRHFSNDPDMGMVTRKWFNAFSLTNIFTLRYRGLSCECITSLWYLRQGSFNFVSEKSRF